MGAATSKASSSAPGATWAPRRGLQACTHPEADQTPRHAKPPARSMLSEPSPCRTVLLAGPASGSARGDGGACAPRREALHPAPDLSGHARSGARGFAVPAGALTVLPRCAHSPMGCGSGYLVAVDSTMQRCLASQNTLLIPSRHVAKPGCTRSCGTRTVWSRVRSNRYTSLMVCLRARLAGRCARA